MTDGVLVTNTTLAFNKSEKESGQAPSKLRMTADTIASFKENIDKGKIPAATEKFNKEYQEIRQALIAAETEAAEQQVRSTVMNDGKTQADIEKEKALEMAQIREDQIISRLSSVDVVKPKLDRLVLEPTTPEAIFGRNEKGLVSKVDTPNYMPKALMVPLYFGKTYKKIGKNSSLYKLADSIIERKEQLNITDPTMAMRMAVAPPPPPKVANWRGLFDNSPVKSQIQISPKKEVREDIVPVPVEQKGLTKEELSDRKMKAQIGEELSEIRRLRKGIAGTTPFNNGLLERENALLQMLSEITGIQICKKELPKNIEPNVTDFQRFIDDIIGYKKPLSAEEHEIKERELEEHYTDPEVVETMRALQLKNILYDLNTPESYERITEAERKDNEVKAAQSTALELLEQTEPSIKVQISNIERDPETEKKKIQQEMQSLRLGAEEQAKLLQSANQLADIKNGAEEQAKIIVEQEKQAEIKAKQEEMLKIQQMEQMKAQQEAQSLRFGAEEQAKILHSRNQIADIKNGAEEQAKIIHSRNQIADIKNGAEEQAKILHSRNQIADIKNGAEEQAKILVEQAKQEEIMYQQEQAKIRQEEQLRIQLEEQKKATAQKEMSELRMGALEQAKILHSTNQMIDIKNGAEEQAKVLYEQAKQEVQMPPVQPPVEQQPKLESLNLELTDINHRYGSIIAPSKPIKVNGIQIGKIRKAKKSESKEEVSDVKEMLVSLKEQLEELGLGTEENTYQKPYSLVA